MCYWEHILKSTQGYKEHMQTPSAETKLNHLLLVTIWQLWESSLLNQLSEAELLKR